MPNMEDPIKISSQSEPRLFFLIPVLNEAPNVQRLLTSLEDFGESQKNQFQCEIVFIDDGSSDDTSQKIIGHQKNLSVKVLRHPKNLGPGAAFSTGFFYLNSLLQEHDWVVTLEGDNTSSLQTLQQMMVRRLEGFDVVIASPYAYGGGITHPSGGRMFLSNIANTLIKSLLGIRGILTMSSFFRLYSAPILIRLQDRFGLGIIDFKGFEGMIELLSKLISIRATISEVAMPLDGSLRIGKSKMKIVKTIFGYFKLFWAKRHWH